MGATESSIIQVIVRASNILDCFCRERPNLSINELATLTGLNKGTVYRILVTLQSIGWIEQDKASRKYHLGIGLFRLGNVVKSRLLIASTARPILEDIQRRCDETVLLYAKYGDAMITLDCITGSQFVRAAGDAGEVKPFTTTVLSICLLAYMSDDEIHQVLPSLSGERLAQLKEDIATVHWQGYFIAPGERYPDAMGISAPIFDDMGNCVAELCLYGPLYRVSTKRQECIDAILNGANQISSRLSISMEKGYI